MQSTDDHSCDASRGAGYTFGSGVVYKFLETNQMSHILRAHQLCMEGYTSLFDEHLSTVWSAPNYCYRCGNSASILEVGPGGSMFFNVFQAAPENERDGPSHQAAQNAGGKVCRVARVSVCHVSAQRPVAVLLSTVARVFLVIYAAIPLAVRSSRTRCDTCILGSRRPLEPEWRVFFPEVAPHLRSLRKDVAPSSSKHTSRSQAVYSLSTSSPTAPGTCRNMDRDLDDGATRY